MRVRCPFCWVQYDDADRHVCKVPIRTSREPLLKPVSRVAPPADVALNPWHPMTDAVAVKHLGKLGEEVSELGAAIFRCLIQGVDEAHPVTGKMNRAWLEDEIADVQAGIALCHEHFGLDRERMRARMEAKMRRLREWHRMA